MALPIERPAPPPPDSPSLIEATLNRSAAERRREYRYRFAQSTVFGLPVIALSLFGPALGGPEAGRWIGLLQVLLAGWVMYVGVIAMLVEGLMRRRVTSDSIAAAIALGAYLVGFIHVLRLFFTIHANPVRTWFAVAVLVAIVWNGARWFAGSRASVENPHR